MSLPMPSKPIADLIKKGVAIPACPLALDANRKLDEQHQKALLRYYCAAGAGGVAVGVHTTQFEIREPQFGLFEPLLKFAAGILDEQAQKLGRPVIKIAGVCGKTAQAVKEAELAASLGYDVALLSLAALKDASDDELIAHCSEVAKAIPIMGFYLQPAVGGRLLPFGFWRRFAEIPNVVAIKMAPFNRYQTLDVVRAVACAGRENEVTLYTGNDDNIIIDLLTPYPVVTSQGEKVLRIKGGLLGQFSVWTKTMAVLLEKCHEIVEAQKDVPFEMLRKNVELTDANAVVFDAANRFAGCIPGINEVLHRQRLLANNYCLNPHEVLSPGQDKELDRIQSDYPWLNDDAFVKQHLEEWLK